MQPYEFLNEWRSSLLAIGLGPTQLIIIGVVFMFSLIIALREVLSWFLKVDSLRREVRSLKTEIENLRFDLQQNDKLNAQFDAPEKKAEENSSSASTPLLKRAKAFRIFH